MGALSCWALDSAFVERFPIYVETGYGTGASLEYAARHGFEKLLTIDIWPAAIKEAKKRFSGPYPDRYASRLGNSPQVLRDELRYIHEPSFFFLDAHFPGEYHGQPLDAAEPKLRLPLLDELTAIRDCKPDGDYTILIDDLRYFNRSLPWKHSEIPHETHEALRGHPFLNDLLAPFVSTHAVSISLNDKGYALISPIGAPQPRYIRFEGP